MTENNALKDLEYIPYLDENGSIPEYFQGKIGVYAIFNQEKVLQFVGYSRDIYLSLKQNLVRQINNCYWIKAEIINRPSRTILEEIRQNWIQENEVIPIGNDIAVSEWSEPIDVKSAMTEAEKTEYEQSEDIGKSKLLKKIARRVEEDIITQLKNRGVNMEIRFNPKLKEEGLLDLK